MNATEEKLWNYIDGNCTAGEQKDISALIDTDERVRLKYQDLVNMNKQITAIEMDEPSMAFTYRVMEAIRTENARAPLKASIDKKIVFGITGLFLITILLLLVYAVSGAGFFSLAGPVHMFAGFKVHEIFNLKVRPFMEVFVFFDIVLALYIIDNYLRKHPVTKQAD